MRKLLSYAVAGGLLLSAMPAAAAVFTPFTMDLSATDVNTATYTYTFNPGTYLISLTQGAYTAFSPATPNAGNWTDYYQYSIAGGSYQYWNPLSSGTYKFADATTAYNAFSAQQQLQLTFNTATSVTFQIGDSLNSLGDNAGGTSLRVSAVSAVPEASSWAMMVIGFGAVGYGLRRRQTATVRFA